MTKRSLGRRRMWAIALAMVCLVGGVLLLNVDRNKAALRWHLTARPLFGQPLPVGPPTGPRAWTWLIEERPLGIPGWRMFEATPDLLMAGFRRSHFTKVPTRCYLVRGNGRVVQDGKAELSRIAVALAVLEKDPGEVDPVPFARAASALLGGCDLVELPRATPEASPRLAQDGDGVVLTFVDRHLHSNVPMTRRHEVRILRGYAIELSSRELTWDELRVLKR